MKYCVKCGERILEENKFCPNCGADNNFKIPEKKPLEKKVSDRDKNISLVLSIVSFILSLIPLITIYHCLEVGNLTEKDSLLATMIFMFSFFGVLEIPISGISVTLGVASYAINKNNILSILSILLTIFPYILFIFLITFK